MDEKRELIQSSDASAAARGPQALLVDAYREGERALRDELERHPGYADLHHRLALLQLARGDHAAAQVSFEEALGLHPGYRAAYYGLRLALLRQELLDPAEDPVPATEPASPEETLWAAVDRVLRLDAAGADPETACEGMIGVAREHYAAALSAGRGDEEGVRRHLEAAGEQSATTRALLTAWGWLPWDGECAASALPQLRTQLWTPLAEDLYGYVGRIYARNGLRDEALTSFDRGYLVHPREATYACHQAEVAAALGEEQRTLELLRSAVATEPTYARARIALGFEYASQGYVDEARQELEQALELAPGYADVRYNLGLLFMGGGQAAGALEHFRGALAINPGYLPARHSMASLLCRTGRHEEGLREYQRILRQGFQSADMLVRMGRAALALQHTDEALQYLERAGFLNPEYAPAFFYLGTVYRRKGLRRKAHCAWRRYLEKANEWGSLRKDMGLEEAPPCSDPLD